MSAFLLTRRGYAVTRTADVNRAAELADRDRVDVILLDASECRVVVSQATTDIGRLTRPVGLVVVAEEPAEDRVVAAEHGPRELDGRPVLAKWGPLEDLLTAIERAKAERGKRRRA
jgi:CheY-like chemotaxis protein